MKWRPRTLFGQIVLALFAGLLIVQIIGLWLMLDDRSRLNYKLLAKFAAQRTAGIVTVLDDAAPGERAGLARALSVEPTTLTLTAPWDAGPIKQTDDARIFTEQFSSSLERPLKIQVLSMKRVERSPFDQYFQRRDDHARPAQSGDARTDAEVKKHRFLPRRFIAQVRLGDGAVVTFHHVMPEEATDLPYRVIGLLALLGLSVAALSAWAVRRLTRPLDDFADAAAGLARNLNQQPLPENGLHEVRRAAQAFNAMQRDLKRHIDTRSQALSAVSHDLRLPITRLSLRLEAVGDSELRDKMAHDLAEMDAMVGHTLDFLRAGSNLEAAVPLNLDALIDSVVEDMEELGATITRHGRAGAPITARPHALRRCIANLLDNARRYGGGAATLGVDNQADRVVIFIEDQGPGIAADELARVCEPYVRLESSRARHTGGCGLGLAIAKAIVEAHGGTLTLASPPGRGLTVTLNLPKARSNQSG